MDNSLEKVDIMFCPKCKAEYREGFTMCSDCSIPLVAELSPEKEEAKDHHDNKDFVELGNYRNPAKVAFINSIFEAKHIRFFFLNDRHVIDGLLLFGGSGGARLFVARADRERAEKMLKDISFDDGPWPFK
jgi:hypothetical protein